MPLLIGIWIWIPAEIPAVCVSATHFVALRTKHLEPSLQKMKMKAEEKVNRTSTNFAFHMRQVKYLDDWHVPRLSHVLRSQSGCLHLALVFCLCIALHRQPALYT